MKRLLLAAVPSLFLARAAAASEATFDLRLDQKDGERAVLVENGLTGAYAVAAGGKDLVLLEADAAKAEFERLSQQPDIDFKGEDADHEHDASGKRKIIVHKMHYDEDDAGDDDKREVRIIKRHKGKSDGADDVEIETEIDLEDDFDVEFPDDDFDDKERRIILVNEADATAAIRFIDRINGLDDAEKAAMKAAVGL